LHGRRRMGRPAYRPQAAPPWTRARRGPRRVRGVDAATAVDAVARADRPRADEPVLRRLQPARDLVADARARRRRDLRPAAARGPDHLRGALQGGFNGLMNVAANRVPLAYTRIVEQWWLLVPLIPAVVIGIAAARYAHTRQERAVATALLGALAASFLVNDS